jgi:hypothetical protein
MVRMGLLVLLIAVLALASLGLVGVVLIASPLLWILLGLAVFCSLVGLVLWGVNGGPQPMD